VYTLAHHVVLTGQALVDPRSSLYLFLPQNLLLSLIQPSSPLFFSSSLVIPRPSAYTFLHSTISLESVRSGACQGAREYPRRTYTHSSASLSITPLHPINYPQRSTAYNPRDASRGLRLQIQSLLGRLCPHQYIAAESIYQ
jgi:hypothetical protein